ncbi:MAG: hypothetical protein AAF417_22555 [Pseudomonadota bacterium]
MRRLLLLLLIASAPSVHAQIAESDAELVTQAVLALPESMRAGATVVRFAEGTQEILKPGGNGMFCQADDPDVAGIAIWCYPQSHDAYARRWYELAADGKSRSEVDEQIAAEIEADELEWPGAAVNYNLRGGSLDTAVPLTVVYVPFATGDELGVTEDRQFNRPWLMYPGTAFAHIMIPGQ